MELCVIRLRFVVNASFLSPPLQLRSHVEILKKAVKEEKSQRESLQVRNVTVKVHRATLYTCSLPLPKVTQQTISYSDLSK